LAVGLAFASGFAATLPAGLGEAFAGALAGALAAGFFTAAAGFFAACFGGGALFAVDLLIRSPRAGLYLLGEPAARLQAGF
jgi:hypothetical protein